MNHTAISPEEQADRLAIRELFDAYAHCADRREAEGQKALFTEDTHFLVYMNGTGTEPTEDLHGSEQLTPVFTADGERKIMLAYLRYLDTFVKQRRTWLFAERNLYLEFSDTRGLGG